MSSATRIHLVCNAHLDPVWLWNWEEGAAEAISTFRTAAEICEVNDAFVFNHNEAILYRWIEEYDQPLFERIRALVTAGRWHIMGGWYLQPDCTMPHGESYVRQIQAGRRYFSSRFGKRPQTAINFDPFGHSRGLVQIMAKAGFTSYLFCRPGADRLDLPGHDFRWVGFDGSVITARRSPHHYNSPLGRAREKVETTLSEPADRRGLILWGIGDHGGGPSKADVEELNDLISRRDDLEILHSTPEAYFEDRYGTGTSDALPRVERSLIPWAVGCYTSQVRIKQQHAALESDLYRTEKMLSHARLAAALEFPHDELAEAERDLLTAEFHDILPGSSIQSVEEWALRLMGHGREILERLRARAFFALCRTERPAAEGTVSVFVYNPHAVPIDGIWECEFNLPDQNREGDRTVADVTAVGTGPIASQMEREVSNINLDWRKRIVFRHELPPASLSRFDCRLRRVPDDRDIASSAGGTTPPADLVVETADIRVTIGGESGLIEEYDAGGRSILASGACRLVGVEDTADPWGMTSDRFDGNQRPFELLDPREAAAFAGLESGDSAERTRGELAPVQMVEDGPVRTVVEAVFGLGTSRAVVVYRIPKVGTEIDIEVRLFWHERDTLAKLIFPFRSRPVRFLGQCPYGTDELFSDGRETSSGRWCAVVGGEPDGDTALLVTKPGIYGADLREEGLRLSLLRSPGYAAHPIPNRPFMADRRFTPRSDQGERVFHFAIDQVAAAQLDAAAVTRAARFAEPPVALSFNPTGGGHALDMRAPILSVDNPRVDLAACRVSHDGKTLIVRLFAASASPQEARLEAPSLSVDHQVRLSAFEVKTLGIDLESGETTEIPLIEEWT